jgi:helicase MOV-10
MDTSKDKHFRKTFALPRKGNSAIRITAPKTKIRQPALSPSEELARAFSQDPQLEGWPKPGATTCGTLDPAASAPDETHYQSEEGVISANGKTSRVLKTLSTNEEPVVARVKAQLSKIIIAERDYVRAAREGASSQAQNQPKDTQRPPIEVTKETISLPTPGPSQRPTPAPPTSIDPKNSSLDVYAINYIPQYLKAINECPAQIRYSINLPLINYAQYVASFAGFTFLQPLDPFVCPSLDYVPLAEVVNIMDLDELNYEVYLNGRMFHELHAQRIELKEYALHNVSFDITDPVQGLYSFIIPGIRESSPRVDLGDTVLVRPWGCVPHEGLAKLAKEWYATNGPKGVRLAPGFSGWEYRAVVWGLQRSKEQVILRLDGFPPGGLRICNISFIIQDHKRSPLYGAIARAARLLHQDVSPSQWLRRMLFPAENHGVLQNTLSKGSFDIPWYDKQLNFEQQKAVDTIIKRQYGAVPFIISGPPGTGKTKTLVEAALQLLRSAANANERCHLLICAPSDSAADTIATRLQVRLNRMELFRLNGWTRSFAEVPEPLMLHSYTENDLFGIPPFANMMNFKVVVTTCRDAEMLVQTRLTNIDLAVLTTQLSVIASSASAQPLRLHWSALLLDEAAQATEAEALIPLTVVQPGAQPSEGFDSLPQFIMAGDEHQLGPRLSLRARSGLRHTLFQRLFEREIYANHPLSRKKGSKPLTAGMLPLIRPPFVNLVRNYRSHPAILTVPSMLFYHDTLIPEVTKISDAVALWQRWNGSLRWPILFVQNDSPDSVESVLAGNGTGAGALLNAGEAVLAQELVTSLLNPSDSLKATFPPLLQREIMVIAAFRAQVNYLRVAFRAAGLPGVNIGPLEAFQGLESRLVVLCTTRTRLDGRDPGRFVRNDQARGIGLIGDAKKFNVALTRAREGLIVIGDAKCLTCTGDKAWAAFIAFCERNVCVEHAGKSWKEVSSDVPPGRMEKALRYAADAKAREEETRVSPTGFGYATPANGVLRGHLPTSDEAMWADGIRIAEENEMSDADEEESGEVEKDFNQADKGFGDIGEDFGQVQQAVDTVPDTPARTAPPIVTVNPSGQLISISTALGNNGNSVGNVTGNGNEITELISLSPELLKKVVKGKENMPAGEETIFDRDLETEIKKEGCEMQ